jgi:hypothetical protein
MQNHAADQLNVEVALTERPLRGFTDSREGRDEQIVQRLAFLEFLAELLSASPQLFIRQRLNFAFEFIDRRDAAFETFDLPLIRRTEDFRSEATEREHLEIRPKNIDGPYACMRLGRRFAFTGGSVQRKMRGKGLPATPALRSLGTITCSKRAETRADLGQT